MLDYYHKINSKTIEGFEYYTQSQTKVVFLNLLILHKYSPTVIISRRVKKLKELGPILKILAKGIIPYSMLSVSVVVALTANNIKIASARIDPIPCV